MKLTSGERSFDANCEFPMIAERIGKEYGSEYQRHNEDCWYATHLKYTNLSDDFPKKPSTIPCVERTHSWYLRCPSTQPLSPETDTRQSHSN